MPTTMTIQNITGLYLADLTPGFSRRVGMIGIAGGKAQRYSQGIDSDGAFTIGGVIRETTITLNQRKLLQLAEMVSNDVGYPFVYIQFSGWETIFDGWYELENLSVPRGQDMRSDVWRFSLNVWRIATLSEMRLATYYTAVAETITTFTGLTQTKLLGLPYSVTTPDQTVLETRTTGDTGSCQVISGPTGNIVNYNSSATVANWFIGECKVYDTVTPGDTSPANWVQVYHPNHVFAGDIVFTNYLIFCIVPKTIANETWYTYAANGLSSLAVGALETYGTGTVLFANKSIEIVKITPEVIEWKARRMYGINSMELTYTLRRGMRACKISLANRGLVADTAYTAIINAGASNHWYSSFFNAGDQDTAASLTADASNNYEVAFVNSRNVIAGFALTVQPANQPTWNVDYQILLSNTCAINTTLVFFLMAIPIDTSAMDVGTPATLTAARAAANAVAQQCLQAIESELILVPQGFAPR